MRTIKLAGGELVVSEPGDPDPLPRQDSVDEKTARLLAAVATIEKREPVVFATELVKARTALAVPVSALAAEEMEKPANIVPR